MAITVEIQMMLPLRPSLPVENVSPGIRHVGLPHFTILSFNHISVHSLLPFIYVDPFLDPTVGNNVEISAAPSPEDFHYLTTTTSYLAIHLTATDSNGLSSTAILEIQPRLVNLVFETVPSGIPILINRDKYATPVSLILWENDKFEIEAPSRLNRMIGMADDMKELVFASWTDGITRHVRDFVVPELTDPDPVIATFGQEEKESEDGGDQVEVPVVVPIDEVKDDTPPAKESTKFIVGLLDMSVSVKLSNTMQIRRRMSESIDIASILKQELKDVVSEAISGAIVSAINSPGSRTAPLQGIRYTRTGERATFGEDGLEYTSSFGGHAFYGREYDEQEVPTEFTIQLLQLQALSEVQDDLLNDLREYIAEAGDVMGYSHVHSVSAEVAAQPINTDSPDQGNVMQKRDSTSSRMRSNFRGEEPTESPTLSKLSPTSSPVHAKARFNILEDEIKL